MKIQKQLSKKRGDKIYHKYVVVLKEKDLNEAKLKAGDELKVRVEQNKIILEKED